MIRRLKLAKARMTSEQEILFNRLFLGTPSGIFGYFYGANSYIMTAFFVYLTVNISLLLMQNYKVLPQKSRLFTGLTMDMLMVNVVMMHDAASMAVFYPMMLWVILGHGFRLGVGWLTYATIAAVISFGSVVVSTEYWAQNSVLGYSLVLTLIAIPAYCSTLIKKISAAKEQAEIANAAKSHFLASVSHELRTPLNAIIGYGNLLKESKLALSQKQMVEASILAGEHLLHLFDQLIQVSRSGGGIAEQKSRNFRPSELLSDVRNIMAGPAHNKKLYLRFQAEPMSDEWLHGPADTVRNLMLNLVSNAIKFTETGGVCITMRISDDYDRKTLYFDVTDTGIGIAEEAQERIFRAFQQADDDISDSFGGTGLGLSICKELLNQISGNISVSSELGNGSCFSVSLPLENTAQEKTDQTDDRERHSRILVFGSFIGQLLSDVDDIPHLEATHIDCSSKGELLNKLESTNLQGFDIALVDQRLVADASDNDDIWRYFNNDMLVPVLVQHDAEIDWEDISLRAAFASVIPESAAFNEIRSAIRIGCSFSKSKYADEEDGEDVVCSITPAAKPQSILVADDNRTNQNILQTVLSSAGHNVTMVDDGEEVLLALEENRFDLLLLDVNMPKLNGLEACKLWRNIEGGRSRLPIIGVTADATEKTGRACEKAGMNMRITKPIDAKALLKIIDQFADSTDDTGHNDEQVAGSDTAAASPAETSENNADQPCIDPKQIEYLQQIGDDSFLQVMVGGFNEDTSQNLPLFRQSVENENAEKFRFYAHAFKSSANNIGALKLAGLCHRLENISDEDFNENCKELAADVERETDLARRELEQHLLNKPQFDGEVLMG